MKRVLVIVLTVLTSLSTQAQQPQSRNSAWWGHVEALAKLKIESSKSQVEVVVIDSIQKPTVN